jgi:nucleotide-binding universal stress UspA family protein
MAGHVLVAYDGSPQSEAALEHVITEHQDADVTALTVIDPVAAGYSSDVRFPQAASDWYENATARAENILADVEATATAAGVTIDTAFEVGRPASTVLQYVADHDVDHIVLGSHGRTGVSRIVLGSVAEAVMRRSPVPVTVVR